MRPQVARFQRRRAAIVFLAFAAALLFIAGRLFWVQAVDGASLASAARAIHLRTVPIPAARGEIVGRGGVVLAVSAPADSVYADPQEVADVPAETAKLAPLLALPRALVQQRLSLHGQFVWVDQGISVRQAQAIRALHLPGIYLHPTTVRRYPQGMLLGQVLGFVGLDGQGLDGLELHYNRQLAGRAGYAEERFDALGNPLPASRVVKQPAQPGLTLRLNIDSGIQFTLQRQLDAQVALSHARQAWGIVMDPSTGAVLAMSAWPTFDPNHFASAGAKLWRNPVVSDTFVPGSIFKGVTVATALAAGVVSPHTPFTDPGVLRVDGVPLHDFQRLEVHTDLTRAFEESANVVYGKVGLLIGKQRFYQSLRAFGLFGPTGVDLPGESRVPDIIRPEAKATPLTLAEMAFGESVAVTPISLMTALNAVVNGGRLLAPEVARALSTPDGHVVRRFEPKLLGRPIDAAVSGEVRTMMAGVVRYGTGQRGFIPCYDVGGKTGTSNIYVRGRVSNQYYASFYGFAPLSAPRVAALVTIVDAQGPMNEGGEVAAPVVQAVLRAALHDLAVPPHCTAANAKPPAPGSPGATPLVLDMVGMPNIVGLTPAQATRAVQQAGLVLKVSGSGQQLLRQNPPPGAMVQKYTQVQGFTNGDALLPGTLVTVPRLQGLTLERAALSLSQLGLNLEATGVGRVQAQDPAAGQRVPTGTSVNVTFGQGP